MQDGRNSTLPQLHSQGLMVVLIFLLLSMYFDVNVSCTQSVDTSSRVDKTSDVKVSSTQPICADTSSSVEDTSDVANKMEPICSDTSSSVEDTFDLDISCSRPKYPDTSSCVEKKQTDMVTDAENNINIYSMNLKNLVESEQFMCNVIVNGEIQRNTNLGLNKLPNRISASSNEACYSDGKLYNQQNQARTCTIGTIVYFTRFEAGKF